MKETFGFDLGDKAKNLQRNARRLATAAVIGSGVIAGVEEAEAQTLKGSRSSMQNQAKEARDHDYDLMHNIRQIHNMVRLGFLVPVRDGVNYRLVGVEFPYARPEVKLFIERFSAEYRVLCGEQLVVTSLVRPTNGQPSNASKLSVHPAGMSVDMRVSSKASCRKVLEQITLHLEGTKFGGKKLIDVTREKHPPHYHIAVFPEYKQYVAQKTTKKK